jgi:hypothetical protein
MAMQHIDFCEKNKMIDFWYKYPEKDLRILLIFQKWIKIISIKFQIKLKYYGFILANKLIFSIALPFKCKTI